MLTWVGPDRIFDVVVIGSGYAGYAATMALRRAGRSVLLIGPRGDLVWESGRSFDPVAGEHEDGEWRALVDGVARRGGRADGWLDGALAEVVATQRLVDSGAAVLYYAHPVAVEADGDVVTAVLVATKSGVERVAARQWVDATERGELIRLIAPASTARQPAGMQVTLALQHPDWSRLAVPDALRATAWPTERVLGLAVTPGDAGWRDGVLAALTGLAAEVGDAIADVTMSHLSFEPVGRYAGTPSRPAGYGNVASASPAYSSREIRSLADRFGLGIDAVAALADLPRSAPRPGDLRLPVPDMRPARVVAADVCVAGTGTGGALAAIAAARQGADVVCLDPLALVGGVGTGGGIHVYWFGVPGGLQEELDRRTRQLMRRFRGGPLGDGPFNPWAKLFVLDRWLRDLGVPVHPAFVFDTQVQDGRLTSVSAATPDGPVEFTARGFVDGTGDGDLCVRAGARAGLGRRYDGMLHAYSQSSGALSDATGRPRMEVVSFEAGFCDPTDSWDLTRARLEGIGHYALTPPQSNLGRPTYIAPAIGIRQGRQIETEYVLTLDDQIRGRRFDDAVGYTGAHFDNHGSDYAFESDEAVFWAWLNRQYVTPVACELSYRMLVPRGLSNLWIASRCVGLTQDAHNITRMQRDVQRLGEVAGLAAAIACRHRVTALEVPYAELRERLLDSGALDTPRRVLRSTFGAYSFGLLPATTMDTVAGTAEDALDALDRGEAGLPIWWLYRHRPLVAERVVRRLADPPGRMSEWLAAGIAAMWGDETAEPRLLRAIDTVERGFGDGWPEHRGSGARALDPLLVDKVAPNWLCAVALLRCCGTDRSLEVLDRLLDRGSHSLDALATVAVTLDRLVRGGRVSPAGQARVAALLDRILAAEAVGAVDHPSRVVGWVADSAVRGVDEIPGYPDVYGMPDPRAALIRNAFQDNAWQLQLAVASARGALGLAPQQGFAGLAIDHRGHVRRAAGAVAARAPGG